MYARHVDSSSLGFISLSSHRQSYTADSGKRVVFGDLLLHLLCELLFSFCTRTTRAEQRLKKWVCTGRDLPGTKTEQ